MQLLCKELTRYIVIGNHFIIFLFVLAWYEKLPLEEKQGFLSSIEPRQALDSCVGTVSSQICRRYRWQGPSYQHCQSCKFKVFSVIFNFVSVLNNFANSQWLK